MNTQAPIKLTSPRAYAAAILAEPLLDRRQALMARCPAEWRDQVTDHVTNAFPKVSAYRRHQSGRAEQARQKPPASPRRTDIFKKGPPLNCSAPEVGNAAIAKLRAAIGKVTK